LSILRVLLAYFLGRALKNPGPTAENLPDFQADVNVFTPIHLTLRK